jgi:hypothetical protein
MHVDMFSILKTILEGIVMEKPVHTVYKNPQKMNAKALSTTK